MFNQTTMDQLAKASRRAALVSLLGCLVVVSSLIYSAVKLHSLQEKRDDLNKEIDALNQQIDSKVNIIKQIEMRNHELVDEVVANPDQGKNTIIPQVYIFTSDQSQTQTAERVADALKGKGFQVPGIENLGNADAPPETQVRFFRYPEDKKDAEVIVDILKTSFGMSASRPAYVQPENAGSTEPRQFEIFFKKNPL